MTLDDRTKGAVVDEHFQTDVAGIFAAGNVLHVHDLVDFVSGSREPGGFSCGICAEWMSGPLSHRNRNGQPY